jgi:flagellar hook-length control protein FliK
LQQILQSVPTPKQLATSAKPDTQSSVKLAQTPADSPIEKGATIAPTANPQHDDDAATTSILPKITAPGQRRAPERMETDSKTPSTVLPQSPVLPISPATIADLPPASTATGPGPQIHTAAPTTIADTPGATGLELASSSTGVGQRIATAVHGDVDSPSSVAAADGLDLTVAAPRVAAPTETANAPSIAPSDPVFTTPVAEPDSAVTPAIQTLVHAGNVGISAVSKISAAAPGGARIGQTSVGPDDTGESQEAGVSSSAQAATTAIAGTSASRASRYHWSEGPPGTVEGAESRATEAAATTTANVAGLEQAAHAALDQAQMMGREGNMVFHFRLDPPNLGTMSVHLVNTPQGVTGHLLVNDEAVRTALQSQIDSLRQVLAQSGIRLGSLDVRAEGGGAGQTERQTAEPFTAASVTGRSLRTATQQQINTVSSSLVDVMV